MKKIFIFLIAFYYSTAIGSSGLDYQSISLIRTYPVGYFTNATFGKSYKFWDTPDNKILYGFFRGSVVGQTSVVVNSIAPQIDFYPISFLGLYAGKDLAYRDFDIFTFDCKEVTCKGWMKRDYIGSRMALAFKDVFLMSEYRIIKAHGQKVDKNFAEERSNLIGHSGYDYLHRLDLVLGHKLSDHYSYGYLLHRNEMKRLDNNSQMNMGFLRLQNGPWSYMLTGGTFHSRDDKTFYSTLFFLQWNGSKGFLLF